MEENRKTKKKYEQNTKETAVAAEQHRREPWWPYAGTAGGLGPPGQLEHRAIWCGAGIPR